MTLRRRLSVVFFRDFVAQCEHNWCSRRGQFAENCYGAIILVACAKTSVQSPRDSGIRQMQAGAKGS